MFFYLVRAWARLTIGWFADRSRSLGPDDTGKSTIIEQMRIISLDGHSEDERQDILYPRHQSNGAAEISFTLTDINWRVVDLGGQCLERKKWMHCFEDVDYLMFVVALSSYDQCLVEGHRSVRVKSNAVPDNDF